MSGLPISLFWFGVLIALAYLPVVSVAPNWQRSTLKTVPLTAFALAALVAGASLWLVAALSLSAIGDFALSRRGERAFLAGLSAFALVHACYVVLFLALAGQPLVAVFAGFPAASAAMVLLALSTELWLIPHAGVLKWPVRGYVVLITLMMLSALLLPGAWRLATAGAAAFVFSDLLLSVELFRMKENPRRFRFLPEMVWVLYIAGQGMILWGTAAA